MKSNISRPKKTSFFLVFLTSILFLTISPTISSADSTTVRIYADIKWNNTDIFLKAGQAFSISANGTANYNSSSEASVSPDGDAPGATHDFLLPGGNRHCLIGRIRGKIFEIGSAYPSLPIMIGHSPYDKLV
ncbi:MAG: hypothetical protein JRC68_09460 [Deltaproteobacteria bacterium]|nr:hypothetical protein [Deltaproteobacteria bacterium]